MTFERLTDWLAGRGVPQPRPLLSVRHGDDALAVGAERCAPYRTHMALERLPNWLSSLTVPQPRHLVVIRGDDAPAVGTERRDGRPVRHNIRDGCPTRQNILMALEQLTDRLAGLGVPQSRRLVVRRGGDALAIGAERRAA